MSMSKSRKTKLREREKPKSSSLKREILDRGGIITVDLGENLLTNHQGLMHK